MTLGPLDKSRHYPATPSAPLKLRPKSEPYWNAFHEALNEAHETGENLPFCDEKYDLYADHDEDISDEMAKVLCGDTGDPAAKCPLFDLCKAYAEVERPNSSIYGGLNYRRRDWNHD